MSAAFEESFFTSKDGTRLFHLSKVPAAPRAVVVVVHGYADHIARYRHVMDSLVEAGFAAHGLDYRGHGRAAGRRGHVGQFSEYLDDLETFIARARERHPGLPLFILAHSHGGLVTASLLLSERAPQKIAGVVMSAPYFRLRIEPSRFQLFQANVVGKIIPFLPLKNPLTVDQLTRDSGMKDWSEKDTLRHHVVTPKWFTESTAAQEALRAKSGNFTLPLLVVQGDADPVVVPEASRTFFEAAQSKDKTFVNVPEALHEVLNEVDRAQTIETITTWITERAARAQEAA